MSIVIFDLDDTLFKEVDFLKSAFKEISQNIASSRQYESLYDQMMGLYSKKEDIFTFLIDNYKDITKEYLLEKYRNHYPNICLENDTRNLLEKLSDREIKQGIVTDGRSITQRNKIKALGLDTWLEDSNIIISEEFGSSKPDVRNFTFFEEKFGESHYIYVGDNTTKDFITPNLLGWTSICLLDNGENIHKQNFNLESKFLPKYKISNLLSILDYLK